ncbi:GNAT family N-acetyltransferase [Salimicrobium salexigens]|uniref:Acetyltransferase (GNAT) family protein n=1 Tax=Salimicrobium salexigens TaxID=908941 RepID=A0ABY1KRB4_9BACI|nr:GNAT family N-acetyltransferase [Salimicrobium salexigens]SIS66982.1 Acetyltransferase (GNAT) family protein [Salimicrobium salexigens]
MIEVKKGNLSDVAGISKVCREGYWATYSELRSEEYIERVIKEFYNHERIEREVIETSRYWGGYFVAIENAQVIGAAGGGMIDQNIGEIFVLYLDSSRRNEGIGTLLLDALTQQQKVEFGAREQWVSVSKGNDKGIPFYEAKGFIFDSEQIDYGNSEEENYISLRYFRKI